jgi:pyruvate/2-oxoglutarate dehydrogenase complex dihydrolipoamide acyltransferase (E2) component
MEIETDKVSMEVEARLPGFCEGALQRRGGRPVTKVDWVYRKIR